MERDSFTGALQRRWWVVVLTTVIGALLGAAPAPERAVDSVSSFQATHVMLINSTDPTGAIVSDTLSLSQIPLLARSGDVPRRAAERLNYGGNSAELASQVTINLDASTNSLTISTVQATAEQAVAIPDVFAEVLSEFVLTFQDDLRAKRIAAAQGRLARLETEITELSARLDTDPDDPLIQPQLDALTRQYSVIFEQIAALEEQARTISFVTQESAQPIAIQSAGLRAPGSRRSRGIFGMLAGGAVGLGAVYVLNLLDRRIRQRAQAEAILGVPVQMTIPVARRASDKGIAVRRDRHDPISDAYRATRSVLALAHHDRPHQDRAPVTLVLSSGPGDGKTTASANIAAAFAEAGIRTVAVNTDFRRPSLSRMLGTSAGVALAEGSTDGPMRMSPTARGLRVYDERLVDPHSTPGDLARKTVQTLPWFTSTFEQVVVDTPPVSLAAEVLELLPHADTIIVMVRLGHTRIDAAAKTAETLRALGITNFVLVVIGGATDRGFNYYGYGYGYGRNYTQKPSRRRRSQPQPVTQPEAVPPPEPPQPEPIDAV